MKASDNSMDSFAELDDLISDNRVKRRKARETAQAIGLPAITKIVELFSRASRPGKVNLLVALRNIVRQFVPPRPPDDYDEDPLSPWILSAVAEFEGKDQVVGFLLEAASEPDFGVKRSAVLCLLVIEPYIYSHLERPELPMKLAEPLIRWLKKQQGVMGYELLEKFAGEEGLIEAYEELISYWQLQTVTNWSAGSGSTTAGGSLALVDFALWPAEKSLHIDNFVAQMVALARSYGPWLYTESESIGGGPKGYGLELLGLEPSQVEIDLKKLGEVWRLVESLADEPDEDDDFRAQFIFLNYISCEVLAEMLDDPAGIHPDILINMAMELPLRESASEPLAPEGQMLVESVINGIEDGRWRNIAMRGRSDYDFYWENESVHVQAIQALGWMQCDISTAFLWQIYRDKSGGPTDRMAAVYGLAMHHELSAEFELGTDLIFDAGQSVRENLALRELWPWLADLPDPSAGFWREIWRGCATRSINDPDLLRQIGTMLIRTDSVDLAIDCLEHARQAAHAEADATLVAQIENNLAAAYSLAGRDGDARQILTEKEPILGSPVHSDVLWALPFPVAVFYGRWRGQELFNPISASQAFTETVETAVKLLAVVLLAETQAAGKLDIKLARDIKKRLDKPGFGDWKYVFEKLTDLGSRKKLPFAKNIYNRFLTNKQFTSALKDRRDYRDIGAHEQQSIVSPKNQEVLLPFVEFLADGDFGRLFVVDRAVNSRESRYEIRYLTAPVLEFNERQEIKSATALNSPEVYLRPAHAPREPLNLWPFMLFKPCPKHEHGPLFFMLNGLASPRKNGNPSHTPIRRSDDPLCSACLRDDKACEISIPKAEFLTYLGLAEEKRDQRL